MVKKGTTSPLRKAAPAVAVLGTMLLVYQLSAAGTRTRATTAPKRKMMEAAAPGQALSVVESTYRRGSLCPKAVEKKLCGAVSKRHRPFSALLDSGLCKQLEAEAMASPFLKCYAQYFVPAGTSKMESPGEACAPLGAPPQLVQGTALGLPCRDHTCCDVPINVNIGTRDCGVFQQVFRLHFYKLLYPIAQKFQPRYILDAGGNAGFSTMMFKLLWPEAVVVGMEPDPQNFATYQRNTAVFKGVHAVNAGLWARRAHLGPVESKMQSWGKVFKEVPADHDGALDAYSVKDVAAMFDIPAFDFIKMDVEGAEGQVFLGENLSWVDEAQLIAIEVHEGSKKYFGLEELVPQIVKALTSTRQPLRGVEDGEHMFLLRQDLLERVTGAGGAPSS